MDTEDRTEWKPTRILGLEDSVERKSFLLSKDELLPVDDIQALSGNCAIKVSAAPVMMEFKGMVKQMDGLTLGTAQEEYCDHKARKNDE